MGLRFDPIGGGQFKQAVKQIIEAERAPIRTLEIRKNVESAKQKLFQEFKTKVQALDKQTQELADFRRFRDLKVDLGEGSNLVGVTLDTEKAEPGSYTVEIDQLAVRTSIISNSFADPDSALLGIGFIQATRVDGEEVEIYVDEKSSSLHGPKVKSLGD